MSAGHDTEKSLKKIEMNVVVSCNMSRIRKNFITVILKSYPFPSTSSRIILISI